MSESQIYFATYSNVPVFEFVTPDGVVMRRQLDSWINATHILKIAKFPKAKRTKILEKDIQSKNHEKIQGGYGKYQGTYVPLELGITLAKKIGVYEILKPIFKLDYVEGKSKPLLPMTKRTNVFSKPEKKKMHNEIKKNDDTSNKKKRGRPKKNTNNYEIQNEIEKNNQFIVKPQESTYYTTLNKEDNPTFEKSGCDLFDHYFFFSSKNNDTQSSNQKQENIFNKKDDYSCVNDSNKYNDEKNKFFNINDSQIMIEDKSFIIESNFDNAFLQDKMTNDVNENLFKRLSFSNKTDSENCHLEMDNNSQIEGIIEEKLITNNYNNKPNNIQSFNYYTIELDNNRKIKFIIDNNDLITSEFLIFTIKHLFNESKNQHVDLVKNIIAKFKMNFLHININQIIDNNGNTILHWLCMMNNLPIIEFLIDKFNVNIKLKNNYGQTPLIVLMKYNCSFEINDFSRVLDFFFDCVKEFDISGKTVLHHIVLMKNKNNSKNNSYLYLNVLLKKYINFCNNTKENKIKKNNLVSELVNYQDSDGNTAFHISAYTFDLKCINVFLQFHEYMDFSLRNLVSHTFEDYLKFHNFAFNLNPEKKNSTFDDYNVQKNVLILKKDFLNQSQNLDIDLKKKEELISSNFQNKFKLNEFDFSSNSLYKKLSEKLKNLFIFINNDSKMNDNIIESFEKVIRSVNKLKIDSQKKNLFISDFDHILKNFEDNQENLICPDYNLNLKNDLLVQEEISRIVNDLNYHYVNQVNELKLSLNKYRMLNEKILLQNLSDLYNNELNKSLLKTENFNDDNEKFNLAVILSKEIITRKNLLDKFHNLNLKVIKKTNNNTFDSKSVVEKNLSDYQVSYSFFNKFQKEKLHKYCKLVSLCCGLNCTDVQSLIEQIENFLINDNCT